MARSRRATICAFPILLAIDSILSQKAECRQNAGRMRARAAKTGKKKKKKKKSSDSR
jgi:hypothetical protein